MDGHWNSVDMLRSYFSEHGMLLCNHNKELPSLSEAGGDWRSIVSLMENGEVFYSKLYRNRVTYLSHEFYYLIKPYRQRADRLSPASVELLKHIGADGPFSTGVLKRLFPMPAAEYAKCMSELCAELFVTVIANDRTINDHWSSLLWGSFSQWEQKRPAPVCAADPARMRKLLPHLSERQYQRLLGK